MNCSYCDEIATTYVGTTDRRRRALLCSNHLANVDWATVICIVCGSGLTEEKHKTSLKMGQLQMLVCDCNCYYKLLTDPSWIKDCPGQKGRF